MKQYLLAASFILGLFACFLPAVSAIEDSKPAALAVEETQAEPAPAEAETEFSYGTVKSIAAGQLVVSEYDYNSDQDVDVTYSVPANTKFEGVASLTEITAGDAVDIDFLVQGDQKIASAITVEKPTAEDEDATALGADLGEPEE